MKNTTAHKDWEAMEATVEPQRRLMYQAQQDFRVLVDYVTYDLKQGQIITEKDVINRLLSVNAPIMPISEDRIDAVPCPHCNRKIELSKIPAIKNWLDLQKK